MDKKDYMALKYRITKDKMYQIICYKDLINGAINIQKVLREKYGYPYDLTKQVVSFCEVIEGITPEFKIDSILDNINFVDYVLTAFGYNEEEKSKFICRNIRIVLGSYKDFRLRLAIFNYFGFLKEAFFNKYRLLNLELENLYGLNTSGLYSVCMSHQFFNLDELQDIISKMLIGELVEYKKAYPYDKEFMSKLDNQLIKDLNKMKFKNDYARRKQSK